MDKYKEMRYKEREKESDLNREMWYKNPGNHRESNKRDIKKRKQTESHITRETEKWYKEREKLGRKKAI